MSYEYSVISNVTPVVLHEKISHLMKISHDYKFIGENGTALSFRHITSTFEWESDVDLSLEDDNVMFYINSGSTEILECLVKLLAKIDICAEFQEL